MQCLFMICTLSLALLVQGLEAYNVASHSRIIGGKDATLGQFPFPASIIRNRNTHICGGSIISTRWIMSAAHCIITTKKELVVLVGAIDLSQGGDVHEIDNIIVHENYNKITNKNDISLINTQKEIRFSKNVQPLKLASNPEPAGAKVVLVGWGKIQENPDKYPTKLQWVDSKTISMADCVKKVGSPGGTKIDKTQTCIFDGVGKGVCSGDSGGPAVVTKNGQFTAIGISSFGVGDCGRDMPEIFTSVSEFVGWINKNIK